VEIKIIKIRHDDDYISDNLPFLSHKKGDIESIDCKIEKYCCDDIEKAMEDNFVCFGEYESYGFNKNENVNIVKCLPWPEGAFFEEMAIKFCPFCGNKIEYIE